MLLSVPEVMVNVCPLPALIVPSLLSVPPLKFDVVGCWGGAPLIQAEARRMGPAFWREGSAAAFPDLLIAARQRAAAVAHRVRAGGAGAVPEIEMLISRADRVCPAGLRER